MKQKPRAIPRLKINITRKEGDLIDGVFEEIVKENIELYLGIQPYNGMRLINDKDLSKIKSSVLVFADKEIKLNDEFIYNNIVYKIKYIDQYYLGNSARYEAIAFSYDSYK
ncbi:hypothetical protein [Silvanigrella sp.]|jgi:hypothetical protein|uniref:hypothetical protein n=1 Tax=Silvanigrella sp. TaxID=2024976 RepID=UPI0037C4F12C